MGGGGKGKQSNKALARKHEKYYTMAKAHGFRSRAAFKLVQLNRKFDFLGSSHVCLDLCAAPGGWMQVAHKYMPVGSTIIGVDLVPIKPVAGCQSFADDITTASCRKTLTEMLNRKKADVVLHDGAPNMGTNWLFDAYAQNELTLKALKLAVEFLRPNGVFVTKVFRSNDYNSLQWVLQKLFKKVTATKPTASRNESAEIFVVCQGFLAPDKLDPRLLDPRCIFKDVEANQKEVTIRVFEPTKKARKNKSGYSGESDVLIGDQRTVSEFLSCEEPILFLYRYWVLNWDDEARSKYWDTTPDEIKESCRDLKLMGKGEAKAMLRWRAEILAKERAGERRAKKMADGEEKDPEQREEQEVDQMDAILKEMEMREKRKVMICFQKKGIF